MTKVKKENQCKVPECDREIFITKHSLCKAHINKFYKTGEPGGIIKTKRKHKPYWPISIKTS